MAFFGIFLVLLPLLTLMLGLIITLFLLMGICLLVIGVTGIIMNKLNQKKTQSDYKLSRRSYNVSSIITGVVLILFPMGFALFNIISILSEQ